MTEEHHRQCSCTDCFHSIGLDQMSAQHLHAKGTRIDQLYCGEYLPMRERKLLDKLIRTRAVYDDVRNEILPDSESSAKNGDSQHREMDDGDKKHKHSGIRNIVDLVDRGEIIQDLRHRNRPYLKPIDQLSDCRTCCSCSSQIKPHGNADIINNHQAKPVNKIQTSSSSRLYAKRKQGDRSRRMRAVHFRTKYIRSDPCTCTTNLSEIVSKRHSRQKSKKLNKNDESIPTTIESKAIKAKRCVCKCNISRKTNTSLQRLKNAKAKVKESIKSSISKIENSFRIRKDSIMIFRDKLMKKRAIKKYECEPYYCIPEECAPPKCYEKIKMRLHDIKSDIKRSYHDLRLISSGVSFKTHPKKKKSVSKLKSKSKPVTCTCEPETEPAVPAAENLENNYSIHEKSFSSKKRKDSPSLKRNGLVIHIEPSVLSKKKSAKSKSPHFICECDKEEKQRKALVLSKNAFTKTTPKFEYGRYTLPPLDRTFPRECGASMCIPDECDFRECSEISQAHMQPHETSEYPRTYASQKSVGNITKTKSKHSPSIDMNKPAKSENIEPKRQAVRISSNFSFNIEFYKEQKNCKKQGYLTHEKIRKYKTRDEKSVSNKTKYSSPRKVSIKNKILQLKTNHALKHCFCTIELKDAPKSEKSSQSLQDKDIKPTTVNNCYCELKKRKSTQTKKQYKQFNDLQTPSLAPSRKSFACDPYFDSDGNCDSLSCKKGVQEMPRHNRKKRAETEKMPRKCSEGTISPYPKTRTCVNSQCSNLSTKSTDQRNGKGIYHPCFKPQLPKKHQKNRIQYDRKMENASNRSAVRIGSNFSFNIEFYKESEPIVHVTKRDAKLEHDNCKTVQKVRKNYKKKRKYCNKLTQSKLKSTERFHSKASQNILEMQKDQQVNVNNTDLKKSTKKQSDNVCECNTTTQTTGPVAYVTSPLLPPFSPSGKCDNFTCKHYIKQPCHAYYGSKNKNSNTGVDSLKSRTKSTKTLSDTGSSKRQMSFQTRTHKSLSSKDFAPNRQEISPHRQVVSIGSTISFNVEFYKTTSSENRTIKAAGIADSKGLISNNNHKNNKCKERMCKPIYTPLLHQRESIRPNKLNNETKESGIKPFLDKCLCTLKLLKGRKETMRVSNTKVRSTYEINTKDTKSRYCQCAIKRFTHQPILKTKQMSTPKVACQSISSGTSKSYLKNHKLRVRKSNKPKSISEKRISGKTYSSANISKNRNSESNKHAVRIGSSFSFNVDFFKEKSDAPIYNEIQPVIQQKKSNKIRDNIHEDRKISRHSQKVKYCNKEFTHFTNNEAKTYEMLKCPERCKLKRDRIDRRETKRPNTKNKSVTTQYSKKPYIRNLLETCTCDKGIEARQKSCKHEGRKISYAASGPEKMKSEIIGTDIKPVKYKTQKTQSNFYKPSVTTKDTKHPKTPVQSPTKQLVRINSNFSFNIAFNKEHGKTLPRKAKPKLNDLRKNGMYQLETRRNNLKDKQSVTVSKNGKSSNLGLMLKHCLCSLKYPRQPKNGKMANNNEKETQLNTPIPYKCQRYRCEKYVTANREQPKAKSVVDIKGPCLKTKKVQSSLREHEPSIKKYSDHIKREKPRLNHRLQSSSKKAVRLGSAFKFDIEFYKKYESPGMVIGGHQDDKYTSFKKLRRDPEGPHYNRGEKDEIPNKKKTDKRLYGSYFHRHREYQVGYLKEKVTPILGSAFQQQLQIWHMRLSEEELKNNLQIVNPLFIQSNPYKRRYTKSNLRGKGKRNNKWRKKHVRFAASNIETTVRNNFSLKPFNKNNRFKSEIYKSCFCDSSYDLQPKNLLLHAQKKSIASVSKNPKKNSLSHNFPSFTKMLKKSLNLQSKEIKSKLIEITPSNKKMTRRKTFKNLQSKHRQRPTKLKTTQSVVFSLDKSTSCKCNIKKLKKNVKGRADNVSHSSDLSSNRKRQCKLSLKKPKSTNVKDSNDILIHENEAQLAKQRNRHKRRKNKPKPQRIQQVFHNHNDTFRTLDTTDVLSKHNNKRSLSKELVLNKNELGGQSTKSKITNGNIIKKSKVIKSIKKFSLLPNSTRFHFNNITNCGDKNPNNKKSHLKADLAKCPNENCKTVIIETIMPYSTKNFRKKRSRTCLSKECKLLIKTTAKKYKKSSFGHILSKSKIDHKKLYKLRQTLNTKRSVCNDICLKRALTNLLENGQSQCVKKTTPVKPIIRKHFSNATTIIENVSPNIGDLANQNTCCVCCRQYSDTDTDKFHTKGHDKSYVSKNNINMKSTQHSYVTENSKVKSFKNKVLSFFKTNFKGSIGKKATSCECGSKICKKKIKLWPSLTPERESKLVCLCHHECKCFTTLKEAKDSNLKKKNKLQSKQRKKTQRRKKLTSNRKSKMDERPTSKLLKSYGETSDSMLLAETYLDVAKMSAAMIWNLMKVPYEVISNPKGSCERIKTGMRYPANKAISIQQKIAAMRVTKNAKAMLESCTVTNFLIHAFDDDPKKRLQALKSKKRLKKRERIDFECSPYMASLRKRPFLWVYEKCPAFYPQFISLLAGWRQFIDMLLFLSAIVIWSPCIFSIELCRAIMCCCLCTG